MEYLRDNLCKLDASNLLFLEKLQNDVIITTGDTNERN